MKSCLKLVTSTIFKASYPSRTDIKFLQGTRNTIILTKRYFIPSVQFQSHAMITKAYCEPLLHQTLLSWATFNSCLSVFITLLKTQNVYDFLQLQKLRVNNVKLCNTLLSLIFLIIYYPFIANFNYFRQYIIYSLIFSTIG